MIFEGLWTLTKWLVEGRANPNITEPSWTLWFLLALGIFRLVLPYLALLRWPLLWTVVISIGAGYLPEPRLDVLAVAHARAAAVLHARVVAARARRRRALRAAAAACLVGAGRRGGGVFAIAGWAAWFFVDGWRAMNLREWLFYDENYSSIGGTQWWAGGVRLALMVVAVVLSTAFFALLPRRTHWWTHFGQYTMYVYLLHSFVLYPFRESGVLRDLEPTWLWLPIVVVASVLIALGLATKPVRRLFRPLVEPRPAWLFADPDARGTRGASQRSHRIAAATRSAAARLHPDPRQNG